MRSFFYTRRILSILCLFLFLLSKGARANSFYVTNLGDAGAGSLRQAITDANNTTTGSPHTIVFNVSGQIVVLTSLPVITSAGLTIDGKNQVTLNANNNGVIFFDINASNVIVKNFILLNTAGNAVRVEAGTTGVTIRNMIINNFISNSIGDLVDVVGASTNLTLRNITSRQGLRSGYSGCFFTVGRDTNLGMDSINVSTTATVCDGVSFNVTRISSS